MNVQLPRLPSEERMYLRLVEMLLLEKQHLFYAITRGDLSMSNIVNTVKAKCKNEGQYGYYMNTDPELPLLIQQMGITSLIDLGAGCGATIQAIKAITGCRVWGVEIEKKLVDISSRDFGNLVEEKDIFKLAKTYLKAYQAIYFWEPFAEGKLCKKFVKLLEDKCSKGHILIYYSAGVTGGFLNKSKAFKRLNSQYRYDIYEKL